MFKIEYKVISYVGKSMKLYNNAQANLAKYLN